MCCAARAQQRKRNDLIDVINRLAALAEKCIAAGNEDRARSIIEVSSTATLLAPLFETASALRVAVALSSCCRCVLWHIDAESPSCRLCALASFPACKQLHLAISLQAISIASCRQLQAMQVIAPSDASRGVQEKAELMVQADEVRQRIANILNLESKLQDAAGAKRAALLEAQAEEGTTFEDKAAQVRVMCAPYSLH